MAAEAARLLLSSAIPLKYNIIITVTPLLLPSDCIAKQIIPTDCTLVHDGVRSSWPWRQQCSTSFLPWYLSVWGEPLHYNTIHHIRKSHYNLVHCIVHHPMHAPEELLGTQLPTESPTPDSPTGVAFSTGEGATGGCVRDIECTTMHMFQYYHRSVSRATSFLRSFTVQACCSGHGPFSQGCPRQCIVLHRRDCIHCRPIHYDCI